MKPQWLWYKWVSWKIIYWIFRYLLNKIQSFRIQLLYKSTNFRCFTLNYHLILFNYLAGSTVIFSVGHLLYTFATWNGICFLFQFFLTHPSTFSPRCLLEKQGILVFLGAATLVVAAWPLTRRLTSRRLGYIAQWAAASCDLRPAASEMWRANNNKSVKLKPRASRNLEETTLELARKNICPPNPKLLSNPFRLESLGGLGVGHFLGASLVFNWRRHFWRGMCHLPAETETPFRHNSCHFFVVLCSHCRFGSI